MTHASYTGRDTIFALSSAPGRAGVAVLRVSGPHAGVALKELTGGDTLPQPRHAGLRRFRDSDGADIDEGLALWFPAPASFTGEDCAEFHIHGGRATVEAMLRALDEFESLRPAGPGEFTRRAVENGKLDLTAAEALEDLINAETEAQRRQALRQFEGDLARLYEGWRASLIRATARVEASIDFADEDIPDGTAVSASAIIADIIQSIQLHIEYSSSAEEIREGLLLTVIGPTNAGKSSLVNALAKRDIAIVSDIPGTTRDIVEARLDLGGYLVIVADTAGLRQSADPIEAEGVRRALARAEASEITLLLLDGSADIKGSDWPPADIVVWNKADLLWPQSRVGHRLSLKTGEGLQELLSNLIALVTNKLSSTIDTPPLSRARHRRALEETLQSLSTAQAVQAPELVADSLRRACHALGRITGRVDIEQVLDALFREFCIGK